MAVPFLRWAGGKLKLAALIAGYAPQPSEYKTYWEPFLGAGAMFFHLRPQVAVLSDLNVQLVECYRSIKRDPVRINAYLQQHSRLHGIKHYYRIRHRYNRSRPSARRAADFIYLNKACFNGLFRVNTEGQFNVPWGGKVRPALPSRDELIAVSRALRRARIRCCDFTRVLSRVNPRDFVYLDPPYPPLNGTAYFRHYTPGRFGPQDQRRVAEVFAALDRARCFVLLSNAATPEIERLYSAWKMREIAVRRWLSCKGERFSVREVIVTNF